jgi:hypothetical protein
VTLLGVNDGVATDNLVIPMSVLFGYTIASGAVAQ